MLLKAPYHCCVVCTDYQKAKEFYIDILGLRLKKETWREAQRDYKLELYLGDFYVLELFINESATPAAAPDSPKRAGLNHLCFLVDDVDAAVAYLRKRGVCCTDSRLDEDSNPIAFFYDPDGQKLELYHIAD